LDVVAASVDDGLERDHAAAHPAAPPPMTTIRIGADGSRLS